MESIKSLLQVGDIIQYRNNEFRLVTNIAFLGLNTYAKIDKYDNNLLRKDKTITIDVMKIYRLPNFQNSDLYLQIMKEHQTYRPLDSQYHGWFQTITHYMSLHRIKSKLIYSRIPVVNIF